MRIYVYAYLRVLGVLTRNFVTRNFVDLVTIFPTRILSQKSASKQPRTGRSKVADTFLPPPPALPPQGHKNCSGVTLSDCSMTTDAPEEARGSGTLAVLRRRNVARFRLYRHRFLQLNMRFAAFFKIYQILKLKFLKFDKILQIFRHLHFFCWNFTKIAVFSNRFFAKILRLQRCKRMQIL